jgi:hypothetical protein
MATALHGSLRRLETQPARWLCWKTLSLLKGGAMAVARLSCASGWWPHCCVGVQGMLLAHARCVPAHFLAHTL